MKSSENARQFPVAKLAQPAQLRRDDEAAAQAGRDRALLNSILELTAQADTLSLNEVLLDHMLALVSGVSVRIYENAAGYSWRLAAASAGSDRNQRPPANMLEQDLAWIEKLLSCDDAQSLSAVDAEADVLLVPVRKGSQTLSVVLLQGEKIAQRTVELAPVIQGFNNLFHTLHRGSHDRLTGLLNRQTFDERMAAAVEAGLTASTEEERALARSYYAILDIDHFKKVNDTYGHLMGDEVLLHFAQLMLQCFRAGDLLFRFGGEEFVVLLSDVDESGAQQVLDRFRELVANTNFPGVGRVTTSVGYSRLDLSASLEVISERADKALYYAKGHGRNQAHCFETLRDAGELQDDLHDSRDINLF